MKRKICSVLFAALLGLRVVFASVAVVVFASAAVDAGIFILDNIRSYFVEKGLDYIFSTDEPSAELNRLDKILSIVDYSEKMKFLTALRDFCKENISNPVGPELINFLTFLNNDNPVEGEGVTSLSNLYGSDWSKLHAYLHPVVKALWTNHKVSHIDIYTWINEHWDDDSIRINKDKNVEVPISDLKTELEKENNTITPKNREMRKYSWRDLSPKQAAESNYKSDVLARAIFKDDKTCFDTPREDGVYFQMYYMKDGVYYYAPYQFRIRPEKSAAHYDESSVYWIYNWYIELIYFQKLDGESLERFETLWCSSSDKLNNGVVTSYYQPYVSFGWYYAYGARFGFTGYSNALGCLNNIDSSKVAFNTYGSNLPYFSTRQDFSSNFKDLFRYFLRSDDITEQLNIESCFNGASYFNEVYDGESFNYDWGFFISSEEFSQTYAFDVSRLPSTGTVTISGGTVYDYSITDSSTGDTSTIYNYINNNYSYPQSSGGNTSGGGNGGSNIGGNITVGGQVDVGGKVEIDVNINGGGNGGGGNGNIGDYVDINSSDVDSNIKDYLDLVPTLPKSFIDYMKDFFSWLPKEIYGLLVFGMIMLVVKLILRRR